MTEPRQFTLSIALGNDAMQDVADVAHMLRTVAARLDDDPELADGRGGPIRDYNGNTVGRWQVV